MKIKAENVKFMCKVVCNGYYCEDSQDYSKMDMDSIDECMEFVKWCAIDYHHNYDGTLHYEIIPYVPQMYTKGMYDLSCSDNKLYVYNKFGKLIDGMTREESEDFVE